MPVTDERVTVYFRPEQLDCVVDALMTAAASEAEDIEILSGVEGISKQCVADAFTRKETYERLAK